MVLVDLAIEDPARWWESNLEFLYHFDWFIQHVTFSHFRKISENRKNQEKNISEVVLRSEKNGCDAWWLNQLEWYSNCFMHTNGIHGIMKTDLPSAFQLAWISVAPNLHLPPCLWHMAIFMEKQGQFFNWMLRCVTQPINWPTPPPLWHFLKRNILQINTPHDSCVLLTTTGYQTNEHSPPSTTILHNIIHPMPTPLPTGWAMVRKTTTE